MTPLLSHTVHVVLQCEQKQDWQFFKDMEPCPKGNQVSRAAVG